MLVHICCIHDLCVCSYICELWVPRMTCLSSKVLNLLICLIFPQSGIRINSFFLLGLLSVCLSVICLHTVILFFCLKAVVEMWDLASLSPRGGWCFSDCAFSDWRLKQVVYSQTVRGPQGEGCWSGLCSTVFLALPHGRTVPLQP